MKKTVFRAVSAMLATLMIAGTLAGCGNTQPDSEPTPSEDPAPTAKPEEVFPMYDISKLQQYGEDSQRWLSVPLSRLVLNPYEFSNSSELTHKAYSDRATLPLNLGYLNPYTTSGTGEWLEDLLTVYEYSSGESRAEAIYELDTEDAGDWIFGNRGATELTADGDALHLTVKKGAPEPWQYVGIKVDMNLDENPILTLTMDASAGSWALKICEYGKEDEVLNNDTAKIGTYSYNIAQILGRGGNFKGVIKLYAIGYEKTLSFSRFDLQYVTSGCNEAVEYETAWSPAALDFSAAYPEGLLLSGYDTFYDENTVLRTIKVEKDGSLLLAGKMPGGGSFSGNVLTVCPEEGRYQFAVTSDKTLSPVYYESLISLLGENNPQSRPGSAGYYALLFENLKEGDTITLAVSLTSDATPAADTGAYALAGVAAGGAASRVKWETYWGEILAHVPTPSHFSIDDVDARGVTAEQVEQMYYIAWVFTLQNVLPANPELNYPYPQAACGKPAMWAYGETESVYSASWESFFGIQLLGYVMPDVAWDALTGLISLVDEDGMLGGESLPSEKAHTAWLLYTLTGDKEKLAAVYEGIARYLDWRMENPRWIYLEHNDVDSADADFVVSALVDMQYMMDICDILGKDADKAAWEEKYDAFLQMYYKWNFDGSRVYQYCNKVTMKRSSGCRIWCTKGLLIDKLDNIHENYLLTAFHEEYDTDKSFAGFSGIKYPEVADTILGLERVKKYNYALSFAECSVRDIVLVGMLAENYTNDDDPLPTGVRPAMFGTAMMIDCVLMMNGFSYQTASSTAFARTGSVARVRILDAWNTFTVESGSVPVTVKMATSGTVNGDGIEIDVKTLPGENDPYSVQISDNIQELIEKYKRDKN